MIPEVAEVSANYNVPYTPPIMEYRQQTVKAVIKVNGEFQQETVYQGNQVYIYNQKNKHRFQFKFQIR